MEVLSQLKYPLSESDILPCMGMINAIEEFAKARGCKNAYELWKLTGLPQATVYRLYNDPQAYPSRETQEAICKALDAQPGDFLRYVPDGDED